MATQYSIRDEGGPAARLATLPALAVASLRDFAVDLDREPTTLPGYAAVSLLACRPPSDLFGVWVTESRARGVLFLRLHLA